MSGTWHQYVPQMIKPCLTVAGCHQHRHLWLFKRQGGRSSAARTNWPRAIAGGGNSPAAGLQSCLCVCDWNQSVISAFPLICQKQGSSVFACDNLWNTKKRNDPTMFRLYKRGLVCVCESVWGSPVWHSSTPGPDPGLHYRKHTSTNRYTRLHAHVIPVRFYLSASTMKKEPHSDGVLAGRERNANSNNFPRLNSYTALKRTEQSRPRVCCL